jgi:hypothetical protein
VSLGAITEVVEDVPNIALVSLRTDKTGWQNAGRMPGWNQSRTWGDRLRHDFAGFIRLVCASSAGDGRTCPMREPADLLFDYPRLQSEEDQGL